MQGGGACVGPGGASQAESAPSGSPAAKGGGLERTSGSQARQSSAGAAEGAALLQRREPDGGTRGEGGDGSPRGGDGGGGERRGGSGSGGAQGQPAAGEAAAAVVALAAAGAQRAGARAGAARWMARHRVAEQLDRALGAVIAARPESPLRSLAALLAAGHPPASQPLGPADEPTVAYLRRHGLPAAVAAALEGVAAERPQSPGRALAARLAAQSAAAAVCAAERGARAAAGDMEWDERERLRAWHPFLQQRCPDPDKDGCPRCVRLRIWPYSGEECSVCGAALREGDIAYECLRCDPGVCLSCLHLPTAWGEGPLLAAEAARRRGLELLRRSDLAAPIWAAREERRRELLRRQEAVAAEPLWRLALQAAERRGLGAVLRAALAAAPPAAGAAHFTGDKWSRRAVFAVSICMVLDFTVSLMSFQALYYLLRRSGENYGMVFGSYDATQLVAAPLMGYWASKRSMREVLLVSVAVNVAGNFIYALAFWKYDWRYMLVSRLVAGLGSANLSVCMTYITVTTSIAERSAEIGKLRGYQTIARMLGPQVGYIFLWLPEPQRDGSVWGRLFNFYSAPGWVAAVASLAAWCIVLFAFRDPRDNAAEEAAAKRALLAEEGEGSGAEDEAEAALTAEERRKRAMKVFRTHVLPIGVLLLVTSLAMWCVTSNLFAVCAGVYHLTHHQHDMWKVFVGIGIGSLLGFRVWKRLSQREYKDWTMLTLGAMCIVGGGCLFNQWSTAVPQQWRYWVGTGAFGMGMQLYFVSLSALHSKLLSVAAHAVPAFKRYIGVGTGVFVMFGSAARFLGPFISSPFAVLKEKDTGLHTCRSVDPHHHHPLCCIEADGYWVDGCEVPAARIFFPVVLGIFAAAVIVASIGRRRSAGMIAAHIASQPNVQG
eukprot:TRINITY_DN4195_c0_g1_i8.p1 TRINITY_DN4195_c0_g1~~TRINITY_DN4195_c0_g1_i8.p1  ORF type:complete len:927 (+),score=281.86 TRINITY_DN4195_c0_g1_i8:119-2782(+)